MTSLEERRWRILTWSAVALFAAFRLSELTRYALWYDELFSLTLAQMSWGDLLSAAIRDRTNPPLFYALLKLWIGVGGESVTWMRLLPCLTAIAAAVPLAALARRTFEPLDAPGHVASHAASLAASHAASLASTPGNDRIPSRPFVATAVTLATAAASPLLVFLANEVRGYSLMLLLAATSLLAFARVTEASRWLEPGASDGEVPSWRAQAASEYRRRVVLLAVADTLLVYTHYFGWLLVAAELGAALLWQRNVVRAIIGAAAATAVAFAPWAIAVAAGASDADRALANVSWITRPSLEAIPVFYDALVARVLTPELAWIGLIVVAVPLGLIVYATAARSTADPVRRQVLHLAWFAGFPVLAVYLASVLTSRSAFVPRYLVVVAPAWCLLIGLAVAWLPDPGGHLRPKLEPRRTIMAGALFCAFTLAAGTLRMVRGGEKIAWDRLTAAIAADAGPAGGPVYALEGFTALPLAWYGHAQATLLTVRAISPGAKLTAPAWVVIRSGPYAGTAAISAAAARLVPSGMKFTSVAHEQVADQAVTAIRLTPR